MNWDSIIDTVSPYLVKIETPTGSGTGFLCAYSDMADYCGIATALHVVEDADQWQQPMRLHSHNFEKTVLLKEGERVVLPEFKTDSAVILLSKAKLDLPKALIELRPIETPLSTGAEVGWLGYPSLEPYTLCFFSGNVSARQAERNAYLIDGVAINGVSGGPVFHRADKGDVQFVGVVSAYRANRLPGQTLPGLLIAQDVSHLHSIVTRIRNVDDAERKRAEMKEKEGDRPPDAPPSPPSKPPTG